MKRSQPIRKSRSLVVLLFFLALVGFSLWRFGSFSTASPSQFDGQRAYTDILAQTNFGPRITGSAANLAAANYMLSQLRQAGWQTEIQSFTYRDTPVRNLIARANVGRGPVILLGAHYDSRRRADQDKDHPNDPVPGADDGASGVAVLLELARTLGLRQVPNEIWLAFFDAEDDGGLDGWDWIVGSTYMASHLTVRPQSMILLDMVGDADQRFYFDSNSDAELSARVWATAARLGYGEHFIPRVRWSMLDDHTPFAQQGIPAIDIIDFDYPYWHTTADTPDKVSPAGLERIGRTVEAFLETPGH